MPATHPTRRALALGVNTVDGQVVYAPVAEAHGLPAASLSEVLV